MTTKKPTSSPSPLSGIRKENNETDSDIVGVIGALESICELESRLRMAIKQTHPLNSSLDWDFEAADRERKALLNIRYVIISISTKEALAVGF
jgi:hypothetical protein